MLSKFVELTFLKLQNIGEAFPSIITNINAQSMKPPIVPLGAPLRFLCPSWSSKSLCLASRLYVSSSFLPIRRDLSFDATCSSAVRELSSTSARSSTTQQSQTFSTTSPRARHNYRRWYDSWEKVKGSRDAKYAIKKLRENPYSLHFPNGPPAFATLSNVELRTLMDQVASRGGRIETEEIVKYLIRKRGEKPDAQMYTALIICNVDDRWGSIARVEGILQEMADENMPIDGRTCHAILKVWT
jgi:hypothetical protein